jgi:hypothetical protein
MPCVLALLRTESSTNTITPRQVLRPAEGARRSGVAAGSVGGELAEVGVVGPL